MRPSIAVEDRQLSWESNPSHPTSSLGVEEPDFVSRQTYETRRFYLNLRPAEDSDLVLVCGGVERMRSNYLVDRKDFPFYAIEWVTEGRGTIEYGQQQYSLHPGVLFAYGPGMPHTIRNDPSANMRKYYLDISGRHAETLLRRIGLLDQQSVAVSRTVELVELWNLLAQETRENARFSGEICTSLLRVFLRKVEQQRFDSQRFDSQGDGATSFRRYETIRQAMEQDFLKYRTVDDVAKEHQISPVYLSRLFQRYGKTGAYRFLLRLRMNHAAELLMEHGMLVKEVAQELSYSDAFQFSRAFKRVYGVAPSKLTASGAATGSYPNRPVT